MQLRDQLEIKTTTPDVASLIADIAELRVQVTDRGKPGSHVEWDLSHSSETRIGATEFRVMSNHNEGMEKFRGR